jgi:DNA-nicking Smr family endonuclease
MSRTRRPSAAELELWRHFTADIEPLEGKEVRRPAPRPQPQPNPKPQPARCEAPTAGARPGAPKIADTGILRPQGKAPRPLPPAALDPDRPVGIDKRTWQRLKRGQIEIGRSLVLHGETQDAAHRRLGRFLVKAAAEGVRCVLVVTGKGIAGDGVLRRMTPRWLGEPGNREHVLTYCQAQPRHGGSGAFYVRLRRSRQR